LSEARQKLVSTGITLQEANNLSAQDPEDAMAYLNSVKDHQHELDQQGKEQVALDASMPALERVGDVDDELNGLD